MPKYNIKIENEKGEKLDDHVIDGSYSAVEDYIFSNNLGHIFKVFEVEPLMFARGDYVRYERNTTGLFDIRRVPFQK